MTRERNSSCTSRKEDWVRFIDAVSRLHFFDILHTGKNLIVEELRRLGFKVRGMSC